MTLKANIGILFYDEKLKYTFMHYFATIVYEKKANICMIHF